MWLSTRQTYREGEPGWAEYLAFINLPQLREVRSLDVTLNDYVEDCGDHQVGSLADLATALNELPRPSREGQYHLLYLAPEAEALPPGATGWRLLGHDLSDETNTSSLLNCGPWFGLLEPFTHRLNRYGLLTLEDALAAKAVLPAAWGDEPHAQVTVWALYEVLPPAPL